MSCGPLFLSIFRRRRARRIPRRHSDVTSRTWWNGLFFSNRARTRWEHFCFRFFFDLSGVQADLFPDYWNKTADFWESLRSFRSSQSTAESVFIWSLQNLLDRPDRLDRTHLYSSDRGRLRRLGRLRSSWQCSPYGRPDRLNIIRDDWDDRDDHMHGKQALASCSL